MLVSLPPVIQQQIGQLFDSINEIRRRHKSVTQKEDPESGALVLEARSTRTARRVGAELARNIREIFLDRMQSPIVSCSQRNISIHFPEGGYPPAMRKNLMPILEESLSYFKLRMEDDFKAALSGYNPMTLITSPEKFFNFLRDFAIKDSVDLAFTYDKSFACLSKRQLKEAQATFAQFSKFPGIRSQPNNLESMKQTFTAGFRNPVTVLYNLFFYQKMLAKLNYQLNFEEIFKAIVRNPNLPKFGMESEYIPDYKFSLLSHNGIAKALHNSSGAVCPVLSVKVMQELKDILFPALEEITKDVDLDPSVIAQNPQNYSMLDCFLRGVPVDDVFGSFGFRIKNIDELFLQGNPFLIPTK